MSTSRTPDHQLEHRVQLLINQFIHKETVQASAVSQLEITFFQNLPIGGLVGTILNNLLCDPKITKSGFQTYTLLCSFIQQSLIDGGVNVGLPYNGSKPDIGAYESGSTTTTSTTPAAPTTPTYYQVSLDASQAITHRKMVLGTDATDSFWCSFGMGTNCNIPRLPLR